LGVNKKDFFKISLITLIFLGLIIAWLAFGERGFIHLYRMEKERQVYQEKIRELEKANQELLEQIERLRNDEDYIESEARRELGLVRENEIIYRFRSEQDNNKHESADLELE
jgi:cell division protein FtsB